MHNAQYIGGAAAARLFVGVSKIPMAAVGSAYWHCCWFVLAVRTRPSTYMHVCMGGTDSADIVGG